MKAGRPAAGLGLCRARRNPLRLFVATFLGVAGIFLAVESDPAAKPSLDRFLRGGIETLTGHCGGRDALVQRLIVPVLLMPGLGAMGVAGMIHLG